jgi:hypothetical protein
MTVPAAETPEARTTRACRLASQALTMPAGSVVEACRRLLGIHAHDWSQAQWALGVRGLGANEGDVREAFASRALVRTWCMRGTLHVVEAADAGWLVKLFAARNVPRIAARHEALGIGLTNLVVARRIVERAIAQRGVKSRSGLLDALEKGGESTASQRGFHLLWRLSQDGFICQSGDDFVLMEDWIETPRTLSGDEALGELARRYFAGHAPATVEDFTYWTGLAKKDARRAIEIAGPIEPAQPLPAPMALLLPGSDEYLVGYADRSAGIDAATSERVESPGSGAPAPVLVLDGRVAGTWRKKVTPQATTVSVAPLVKLSEAQREAVTLAASRVASFFGPGLRLVWGSDALAATAGES